MVGYNAVGEGPTVKRPWKWLFPCLVALLCYGCATLGAPTPAHKPGGTASASGGAVHPTVDTLKNRLDFVLQHNVKPAEVPHALGSFSIQDYDIQDPGTFWGHRALVSAAGGSFSEYYLTYRKTYVILLLKDMDASTHVCVDARIFARTSPDYELSTGRVQVDEQPIDEDVIVLVNRKWSGGSSTDIRAAFRSNVETGRIEDVTYSSIRIFREE